MAAVVTCVGCGGSAGVGVSGTVKVNGELLQTGKITYRPLASAAGNGGSAVIIEGNYQLADVPIGANVFTFSGSVLTGKSIPGPGGDPEPERKNTIPQQILKEGVEREISASLAIPQPSYVRSLPQAVVASLETFA
ncbi:hypothetical protein [Lacipirellula sp.]|uniref:hypothetical protein n=1 Tax=Lacipirellula sp. TaxID=2691419 RepID=UPI003D1025B6